MTRRFLRRRFWIATLVLLVTLILSAAIEIVALRAQVEQGNFLASFHRLDGAVTRLEQEFARLERPVQGRAPDRSDLRAAFVSLLARFRAISAAARDEQISPEVDRAGTWPPDHLNQLAVEFGAGGEVALVRLQLGGASMPDALKQLWDPIYSPDDPGQLQLELAISRLLRQSVPLVRGSGALSPADRRQLAEVKIVSVDFVRPMLARVSAILDAEIDRTGERALAFVLILSGVGIAASLLNFFTVFRHMERSVLASQDQMIRQRDKAIAADMAKRNFLSVVSHELRTPMNGVLGFASLLLASDLKPEHRKQVAIIQSSGKSLLALVNDILDFSKLEAGSLALENEPFSLEEVISEVVSLMRGAALEKRLEMSVFFDPDLPGHICGDSQRMRQVLTNLVGNAVKFTDRGSICIEAHMISDPLGLGAASELQLAVSDTGIGIPADKIDLIFERFTQVDTSSKRKFEGTGLGLSICKQLVEKMGGRIWIESTFGAGSVSFIRVPLGQPALQVPEGGADAEPATDIANRRVLVVDGQSANCRITPLQLEAAGLRVDCADSAAEALRRLSIAAAAGDPYSVAMVDDRLPDLDGAELAQQIRAGPCFKGLRLLLASAAEACDLAEAHRLGFDAVENKPILPSALMGAMRELMSDGARPANDRDGVTPAPGHVPVERPSPVTRILLVDDDPTSRQLVLEMLSCARFRVETAADGLEAVRAIGKLSYDVVLMDIRMPVMGGIETTRRIRASDGGASQTPIVALTANLQNDDAAEFLAAGMQDILEKPADRETLVAAIDTALRQRSGPGRLLGRSGG